MLSRRSILAWLSGCGLSFLKAAPAMAHAVVIEAYPAQGATLPAGPLDPWVRFNSRVDYARSRLSLIGADGSEERIPLTEPAPAAGDRLLGHIDGLIAGSYKLRWQVLSLDGHITRGDIEFTVAG